jgi:hypothetical protein
MGLFENLPVDAALPDRDRHSIADDPLDGLGDVLDRAVAIVVR